MLQNIPVLPEDQIIRKMPIDIQFTYLGTKDISLIPKTCCIISCLLSNTCNNLKGHQGECSVPAARLNLNAVR